MRTCFALTFLMAAAAAPVHGQRAQPVHRGDGYEIVLPTKCRPVPAEELGARSSEDDIETPLVAAGENTLVMVMRRGFDEIGDDTTLATRRAMLHLARVGILRAASSRMAVAGEPREFERDDRVGIRIPVTMPAKDGGPTVHGTAEVSVARRGEAVLWVVMVFDRRRDATVAAAGERVLDSFHLTEAAPSVAEKESDGELKGFARGTALQTEP
jgi:hypothetical protein